MPVFSSMAAFSHVMMITFSKNKISVKTAIYEIKKMFSVSNECLPCFCFDLLLFFQYNCNDFCFGATRGGYSCIFIFVEW